MAKAKGPKRPTRDEFELEELGERLVEAMQEKAELLLTIWAAEEQVRGVITELDSRTKKVHVEYMGNITKIPFLDIMKVDHAR